MKVVVDTNVIAYLLLGTEGLREEAKNVPWRRDDCYHTCPLGSRAHQRLCRSRLRQARADRATRHVKGD